MGIPISCTPSWAGHLEEGRRLGRKTRDESDVASLQHIRTARTFHHTGDPSLVGWQGKNRAPDFRPAIAFGCDATPVEMSLQRSIQ